MELKPFTGELDTPASLQPFDGRLDGESSGALRRAADYGITAVKGAIGVPEVAVGIGDLVSGGRVGKAAETLGFRPKQAKAALDEYYSPEQKAANAKVQAADGFVDTVKTALQNPSTIAHAAVESVPSMLGGGLVGRGLMKAAPGIGGLTAGAVGEGTVMAGSAAEQIRQQTADGLLTGKQAALAAGTGVLGGVIGRAGGAAAQRMGIGDIDAMIAAGTTKIPGRLAGQGIEAPGLLKRIGGGALSEGVLEELPQSATEQALQNVALDRPVGEGVANAAAMGMLTGGLMGAGAGAVTSRQDAAAAQPPPPLPGAVQPQDMPAPASVAPSPAVAPDAGPLTRASSMAPPPVVETPPPAPIAPEIAKPLLDFANQRAAELDAKEKGVKDQKTTGPDEEPVTVQGQAPQFLTPEEKAERAFLKENGGDAAALAQAYPDMAPTPPVDTEPARMMRDADPQAQREVSPSTTPPPAALSTPQAGDIKNAKGEPFKAQFQAASAQKAHGGEIVQVMGGWVVRKEDANVSDQNAAGAVVAGTGGQLDSGSADSGRGTGRTAPVQQRGDRADAPAPVGGGLQGQPVPVADGKPDAALSAAPQTLETNVQNPLPTPARTQATAPAATEQAPETARSDVPAGAAPATVAGPAGVEAAGLTQGEKIDKDWTAFTPESGTRAVPRADMPQIKAEHRGAMVNFLAGRGITHESADVAAADLKPTQAEFSPAKVAKAKAFEGGDRSILVSSDGHVLDGHHQWLAKREAGETVKVIRLNAPIDTLLTQVKEFPSVQTADGATSPTSTAPARPGLARIEQGKAARLAAETTVNASTTEGVRREGKEVSRFNGKFGKGMAQVPAAQKARELNQTAERGIIYSAEEHGDPTLEHPWAVVGRKAGGSVKTSAAAVKPSDTLSDRVPSPAPAPSADGRPGNWRSNFIAAASIARKAGIEPKGKKLPDLMNLIDEADAKAKAAGTQVSAPEIPDNATEQGKPGPTAATATAPALTAAKTEAASKKADEAKAKADAERGEFTLTGSNRAVDKNPDQSPLFSRSDLNAAGRTNLNGFERFGQKPAEVEQARRQVAGLVGAEFGFNIELTDTLPDSTPGALDRKTGRILLNADLQLSQAAMVEVLTEETLHAIDSLNAVRVISPSSPRLMPGGDMFAEATEIEGKPGEIGLFLQYPLRAGLHRSRTAAELFARLGTVYYSNPEQMRQLMPVSYEVYHELFGLEPRTGDRNDFTLRARAWREAGPSPALRGQHGAERQVLQRLAQRVDGKPAHSQLGQLRAAVVRNLEAKPAGAFYGGGLNVEGKTSAGSDALRTSPGLSQSEFTSAVAKAFGPAVADRLQAKGVVVPLADQSKLPAHVVPFLRDGDIIYGFYDPKTNRTYAVLENLDAGMVKGLVLHEVGVHYGFETMLGKDKYAQVMKRLDVMHRMGSKSVREARAQAQANAARDSQVPEETLAYLVQTSPEMGLIKEVIARIKAFLFREFGIGGKYLTEADLTALATAAVQHASRTQPGTRRPGFVRGTTSPMASKKDVVGNTQGGRSADDSTPGAKPLLKDSNGQPLTLYHGGLEWDTFDSKKSGRDALWLTPSVSDASGYADQFSPKDGREIKAFNVRMDKPLDLTKPSVVDQVFGEDAPQAHEIARDRSLIEKALKYAKDNGYDGMIHPDSDSFNRYSNGRFSYVVFSADQLQLAPLKGDEQSSNTYDIPIRGAIPNESTAPDSGDDITQSAPRIENFHGMALRRLSADIRVSAASAFADEPFTILPGVREVKLSDVALQHSAVLDSQPTQERIQALAKTIDKNQSIEPVLVARRADGSQYVAEGQHRARALMSLGFDSLPARIMQEGADSDGAPLFSRTTMAGQTSRQYTPAQERAMRNVGFQVKMPTAKERAQALWQDAGKKLAQGIFDQFAPVKDLSKEAYGLLRLAKGASGAFEAFLRGGQLKLTDGAYDFDDTKRGGVVDRLLIPLQGEHHDFMRWVAANRAERLAAEGKENLFTPQDIADLKTLAGGQLAFDYTIKHGTAAGTTTRNRGVAYRDSLVTFNEFNKNALDMAEQSGLIDGASRHLWEHEFYVPFYRVADDADGGVRGMNIKGAAVRQQAFKQLKGGKNALNADLLDNTLMNWAHLLDAAAKNRAAKATLEAAERMGVAIGAPQSTAQQIGTATGNKNGVVWFMDGGQKRFFVVDDPYVLTAISALEFAGMRSPVMNAMSAFKHVLTVGVTASPFFKVRNLIRDSVQVIATSQIGVNPAGNIAQGWKLTNPRSDAYFRLLAGGGTIHFGTMLEGSEAKRVQSLVESGVDDSTILNSDAKVKAFYRKFIEPGIAAYNELGNRGEAINRATLYAQLTAQGMSHADASLQARDLMDFSMQGSFTSIRFLSQVVPFFNARLQGMYKLGRAAKEDPARFSAVLGATALFSLGLLAAFGDDDDWQKRELWDRQNYWWFKFGGTAFRIPKPFEIGAIATLAEHGAELMFDDEMTGKRFRKAVLQLVGDNMSMNPVPQLVKPIIDVYSNKNAFSGRPIETMGMEKLKPEYRFNDRTSMAARGASTAINSVTGLVGADGPSPVQIDHLLRGYFGWLGSFVVGAGDVLARPATGQPGHAAPDYWKTATGGMVSDLRDAPSRYVSAMYDQAKEIEQAYGTWRALQKEGKTEDAAAFREDNKADLAKYRQVERIKRNTAALNQQIKVIERSDLTGDEKRERIRAINDRKDQLARVLAPA